MTNTVGLFNVLLKVVARIGLERTVQEDGKAVLAEKANGVQAQREPKGNTCLVTVKEMADILHVSPSWIYSRTYRGSQAIPFVKVGRYVRFDPQEVVSFFKTRSSGSIRGAKNE